MACEYRTLLASQASYLGDPLIQHYGRNVIDPGSWARCQRGLHVARRARQLRRPAGRHLPPPRATALPRPGRENLLLGLAVVVLVFP